MNKIEYFNKEYSYIKDNKKREDLKLLVNELPDYFFDIPASSTGKYHPDFAKSEHGLVKHTKVAVRFAKELLDNPGLNNFSDNEKDIIIMAIVLHDGCKSGRVKEKYTRFDHPLVVCELIKESRSKLSLTDEEFNLLIRVISSHMGIWNKRVIRANGLLQREVRRYYQNLKMMSSFLYICVIIYLVRGLLMLDLMELILETNIFSLFFIYLDR